MAAEVSGRAARMGGMTSLLSGPTRPARTAPEPPTDVAHRRPLVLLALLGGVAAAAGPLVVCLGVGVAGWFLSDAGAHGAPRDGLRAGAYAWLMGHGSGLTVAGVTHLGDPAGHHRDLRLGRVADRTPGGRLGLRPRTRRRRDRRRRPRLDRACGDGPVHGGVRRRGRRDAARAVRRLRARVRHPRGRLVPAPVPGRGRRLDRDRRRPGRDLDRVPAALRCGPPRRSASRSSPRSCSCRRRCSWSRSRSTSAPPST